jgi:hypothetical protein
MKRLLLVGAAAAAVSLSACAPSGYRYGSWTDGPAAAFTLSPNDDCRRREIEQSIVNFLNGKVGQPGGPPALVLSATGFVTIPNEVIHGPTLTCRGILQTTGGPIGPGAVQLRLTDNGTANVFTALDAAWETDADRAQKEAAARRETAIREGVLVAQETNFRGNMATWTGIPPMPPSASPSETPMASTHCTVTDVANHQV